MMRSGVAGEGANRRIRLVSVTCFCLAAAFPQPTVAQMSGTMETGTLMPNAAAGGFSSRAKDARTVMAQFAACTYRRSPARVEKMLRLPMDGAPYKHMVDALLDSECLGTGSLQFSTFLIRGALFEQIYMRDFGRDGPDDVSKAPLIDYTTGYIMPLRGEPANLIALTRLGDCTSRIDGVDARRLILSLPDTPAEANAFAALTPHLRRCIVKSQTISFSRSTLRVAFDEAMFRLSRAQASQPWEIAAR